MYSLCNSANLPSPLKWTNTRNRSERSPKWKCPNWAQLAFFPPWCHVTSWCYKVSDMKGEQVLEVNLHCFTSCTLTTLHYIKVSFSLCFPIKRHTVKYLQKCEERTHLCDTLYEENHSRIQTWRIWLIISALVTQWQEEVGMWGTTFS